MAVRFWTSGPNRPCADACVAANYLVTLQASLSWGTTLAGRFFFMHATGCKCCKVDLTYRLLELREPAPPFAYAAGPQEVLLSMAGHLHNKHAVVRWGMRREQMGASPKGSSALLPLLVDLVTALQDPKGKPSKAGDWILFLGWNTQEKAVEPAADALPVLACASERSTG